MRRFLKENVILVLFLLFLSLLFILWARVLVSELRASSIVFYQMF